MSFPHRPFSLTPSFPTLPSPAHTPSSAGVWVMGGGVSVCKSSSLPLPPPHTFPLLQHQSSPQAAVFQDIPVWACHKLQFLQGMSPGSGTVLSTGCRQYLLHRHPLHGLQGNLSSSTRTTFSLPYSLVFVSSGLSRYHRHCRWAWLCPVVGLLRNYMELAELSTGAAPGPLLTESISARSPAANALAQVWTWVSKH